MSEIALPKVDRVTVSKKDIIVSSLKNFTSNEMLWVGQNY